MLLLALVILAQAKLTLHQQHLHKIHNQKTASENVDELTYSVPLDHYNVNNQIKFDVKYFKNAEYFDDSNEKSPIFVMLGGEGPESASSLTGSFVINDLAKKHNGLMIAIEHRFYGTSTPSLEMDYLKYCTAEQALLDYIEIIQYVKESMSLDDHPVIVLGGSYSGNLAAWIRQKYPNVIDGAWASSAPVEAIVDFYEYLEVVQAALPEGTADVLTIAFEKWDEMTSTEQGRSQLDAIFKTCDPLNSNDLNTFEEYIGTAICGYVQYNSSSWRSGYESSDSICYSFMNDVIHDYPEYIINKYLDDTKCVPTSYEKDVQSLKNTTTYEEGNSEAAGRSWVFQTCIAYGYYQAVTNQSSVTFGKLNSIEGSYRICEDVYGIDKQTIYDSVDHVNVRYGKKNPGVTGVTFTSGTTDPWHALAVTEECDGNLVQLLPKISHCSDLYSEKADDVPYLKIARHKEMVFFDNLLKNLPTK
ncbi:Lysosomal Pro-Xaa carboxypeptidase [Entamoeba marina]